MAEILAFPGHRLPALRRTQALLKQAETSAHRAAAQFGRARAAIDQAHALHDRCNSAIESANLNEMIRLRDALALEIMPRR